MTVQHRRPRTAAVRANQPHLPSEVKRRGPAMMNQQCWCWGCDIRRTDGNLLLEHGFDKQRVPTGEQGSSMYTLVRGERVVTVWSFGLWYGDSTSGGVYISRVNWRPALMPTAAPSEHIWSWKQIPPSDEDKHDPRMAPLLAGAMDWLGEYEEWVAQTAGLPYRQQCLHAWRKRCADAAQLAPTWRRLARRCQGVDCGHDEHGGTGGR